MRIDRLVQVLVAAVATCLMAGCGGGGDDAADPPSPPPVVPPPIVPPPVTPPASDVPALTITPLILDVRALTADPAPSRILAIGATNLPATGEVFAFGTYSARGIELAEIDWFGRGGRIFLTFRDPGALEPGIYADFVSIRGCLDAQCQQPLQDSPWRIPVTYTVEEAPTAASFSRDSLVVQGDNLASNAPIQVQPIAFTVAHPTSRLWARFMVSGNGAVVTNASVNWPQWPSRANGVLDLTLRPPSTLGAGTYTDSVRVDLCLNEQCSRQAAGTPLTIPVTYEVTGSALPTISVRWTPGMLTGAELNSAETRTPKMTLTLIPSSAVHGGVYARYSPSTSGLITGVVQTQVARGTHNSSTHGAYEISLKPPATLGRGTFTDSMEFEACFDAACTVLVPGSKYTLSISMVIPPTEGLDFTRRLMTGTNGAMDVAWSPATQLLYVSASFAGNHRIIQVDPATGTLMQGPLLGAENLNHLAVTSDGAYLYAGSRTRPFVHRLRLPAMTMDMSVSLGNFTASIPYLVSDLATLPGQPDSFVVAIGRNRSHGGVFVYDNAAPRSSFVATNPAQTFESERWLVPGAAAGTYLSQSYGPSVPKVNTMELLAVDATGISRISSAPTGHEFFYPKPERAGARMFTIDGRILDAASGAIVGTLPAIGSSTTHALLADEARNRMYVATNQNQREVVLVYDLTTLQQLASVPVYTTAITPGTLAKRMATWGTNGLALTDGNQLILLSGPAFAD